MKKLLLILALAISANAWTEPVNLLCEQELDVFANNPNKYVYFFQLDVEKESLNSNFEIIAVSLDGNKQTWKTTVKNNNLN